MWRRTVLAVVAVVAVIAVTACSGGDSSPTEPVDRAATIVLDSDLHNLATAEASHHAANATYTGDVGALSQYGFRPSPGVEADIARATATDFCAEATLMGETRHVTASATSQSGSSSAQDGPCPS